MQKLLSYVRRAVDDYQMIQEGDSIAVGVSGGKDSLALLAALAHLRRFYPKKFTLKAITLDMGYEEMDFTPIRRFCEELDVEYILIPTQIKTIIFDIRKEENPCALCAKMRRGALHEAALAAGCDKIALGHHFDDVVETYMLSLFYEGRINCFQPVTYLDRRGVTLLRPLLYTPESYVRSVTKRIELPVVHNPCPADGNTKREEVKVLLRQMEKENHGLRQRIFGAIQRYPLKGWDKKSDGRRRTKSRTEDDHAE